MRLFLVSAAIHRGIVTRPTTAQGFPRGMAESSIQPYNATAMVLSANAGSLRPLVLPETIIEISKTAFPGRSGTTVLPFRASKESRFAAANKWQI